MRKHLRWWLVWLLASTGIILVWGEAIHFTAVDWVDIAGFQAIFASLALAAILVNPKT